MPRSPRSAPGTTSTRPASGIPELRHAVAAHQRRLDGLDPTLTPRPWSPTGATEAIAAALLALCDPGDEVVTFEPYYDSYAACIAFAGASRRVVTLRPPRLRPSTLTSCDGRDHTATKLILLNSPHNPTGKVFDREELDVDRRPCRGARLSWSPTRSTSTWRRRPRTPVSTLPGEAERTSRSGPRARPSRHRLEGRVGSPARGPSSTRCKTVQQFMTYVRGARSSMRP